MGRHRLSQVIGPAFAGAHRAIADGLVQEVVACGGRGSGKSSWASTEVVLALVRRRDCNAVVLRKVAATLRSSVYAQVCWAIGALGLREKFRCTVTPMECVYRPTGQKILFLGLDDASKLKSIKAPFGYWGVVWFEELDQFDGEQEIRSVEQSILRGGSYSLALKTFNPPAMARSWANRYARELRPGKLVHHSTYLQTPRDWLGERFWADAEHLRETDEMAYRHEYLGEVVGSGNAVFENLQLRAIGDAEIAQFDRVVSGVDWGWYPDPWAFNRCYYDAARRTLYLFDELTRRRTPNRETAALVAARVAQGEMVLADSAEQKSVADYCALGLRCRGAQKGPGSVNYSHKWLQGLAAIVIDPARCPDTAREFAEYAYSRDTKTGEVLPGYPDADNHHIDAVRYATSLLWKKRGI